MKKTLSLLMALCLLFACASVQAEGGAPVNPAGEFPIVSEPTEMSVLVINHWNMVEEDFENDPWLQEVEEKTGIRLKVVALPSSDAKTKRNLLLAGDDYPEIDTVGYTFAEIMQFGVKDGILVDLKPYYDEYGYELKRIDEYNSNYVSGLIAPDGALYGVPSIDEGLHTLAYPKMYIRQDWLDQLDLEMPTTTEEFRDMLRAFTSNDLNGDGKNEIGLTGATASCLPQWSLIGQSFINLRRNLWLYVDEVTQEIQFAPAQDAYREGLRYVKSLYDEGLIDPAAFTQTADQMAVTIRTEPYSVGSYVCEHVAMGVDSSNYEEYKNYQVLPVPLKGPDGFCQQPKNSNYGESSNIATAVTDKCENVAAAFRLLDYFSSEEQTMIKWLGQEGVQWERIDPAEGIKTVSGSDALYRKLTSYDGSDNEGGVKYRTFGMHYAKLAPIAEGAMLEVDDMYEASNYEIRIYTDTLSLKDYSAKQQLRANVFMDAAVIDEYNEIKTNLDDFIYKTSTQFIIGDRDIETGWETYLDELSRYQVERYVELYSAAYNQ